MEHMTMENQEYIQGLCLYNTAMSHLFVTAAKDTLH